MTLNDTTIRLVYRNIIYKWSIFQLKPRQMTRGFHYSNHHFRWSQSKYVQIMFCSSTCFQICSQTNRFEAFSPPSLSFFFASFSQKIQENPWPLRQDDELIPLTTWLGFCSEDASDLVRQAQELVRSALVGQRIAMAMADGTIDIIDAKTMAKMIKVL